MSVPGKKKQKLKQIVRCRGHWQTPGVFSQPMLSLITDLEGQIQRYLRREMHHDYSKTIERVTAFLWCVDPGQQPSTHKAAMQSPSAPRNTEERKRRKYKEQMQQNLLVEIKTM